ncbi:MAG: nicotinate-nicotinamide nucleotide adenylyltransferase [Spirochaetia bacterium]|jgi:nicotinate-nucleotide adenylyltransferase|nr:nicotinate-nicotinamide nucleotide adenylyltransferase [Spirochaetia bacterium]
MRAAMFGGSFDPIHRGHLYLLHTVCLETDYRRIFLVPAYVNNFKQGHCPGASGKDRLALLELAVKDYKDLYPQDDLELIVSPAELERGGISYTYDTVTELMESNVVEGKFGLLIGDDLLAGVPDWYQAGRLRNLVEYVVCRRSEIPAAVPDGFSVHYLHNVPFQDSSTEIRRALHEGEDTARYLSKRVKEYVERYKLYRD